VGGKTRKENEWDKLGNIQAIKMTCVNMERGKVDMTKNVKILSDEKIELIVGNVKASLAIEGLNVTGEESEIYKKYLKGDLTEGEVLKIFQNKGGGKG